jgi:hypothetical protein
MADVATLVDAFDGGAISGLWSVTSGTVAVTGTGQLQLTPGGLAVTTYSVVTSVISYSLRGSAVHVDLMRSAGATGAASYETIFRLDCGSSRYVEWMMGGNGTAIVARYWTSGTNTDLLSGTWSPLTMRYLRISESGGVATFSYSSDAATWTTYTTVNLNTPWVDGWQDVVSMKLMCGHWQTEAVGSPEALFEGVNVILDISEATRNSNAMSALWIP